MKKIRVCEECSTVSGSVNLNYYVGKLLCQDCSLYFNDSDPQECIFDFDDDTRRLL